MEGTILGGLVAGKIILKQIFKKVGYQVVDWIKLVRGRANWRFLVNTVLNIRVL
jgi:hypothetical protein